MRFEPTRMAGVMIVHLERQVDSRGSFARAFCEHEFTARGLPGQFVQCNISVTAKQGTLRGMHFQRKPHEEGKLVRCTRGAIHDVMVDLRQDSSTYCQWLGFDLDASTGDAIYIPPGMAHGFQTLVDNTEVFYQMTEFYYAELADGVRWDDKTFGIKWPIGNPILSDRDRSYPRFRT